MVTGKSIVLKGNLEGTEVYLCNTDNYPQRNRVFTSTDGDYWLFESNIFTIEDLVILDDVFAIKQRIISIKNNTRLGVTDITPVSIADTPFIKYIPNNER